MNKHLFYIWGMLLMLISHPVWGQDEFFHEISLEKAIIENEKWALTGEANWKNLYNQPGWRRWGVSIGATRRIHWFRFSAGVNGYYTFNKSITNFFEFRPWMAAQCNIPLGRGITLRQRLKSEWRFFFQRRKPPQR